MRKQEKTTRTANKQKKRFKGLFSRPCKKSLTSCKKKKEKKKKKISQETKNEIKASRGRIHVTLQGCLNDAGCKLQCCIHTQPRLNETKSKKRPDLKRFFRDLSQLQLTRTGRVGVDCIYFQFRFTLARASGFHDLSGSFVRQPEASHTTKTHIF